MIEQKYTLLCRLCKSDSWSSQIFACTFKDLLCKKSDLWPIFSYSVCALIVFGVPDCACDETSSKSAESSIIAGFAVLVHHWEQLHPQEEIAGRHRFWWYQCWPVYIERALEQPLSHEHTPLARKNPAPGRVDSPPISTPSAPCSMSILPCCTAFLQSCASHHRRKNLEWHWEFPQFRTHELMLSKICVDAAIPTDRPSNSSLFNVFSSVLATVWRISILVLRISSLYYTHCWSMNEPLCRWPVRFAQNENVLLNSLAPQTLLRFHQSWWDQADRHSVFCYHGTCNTGSLLDVAVCAGCDFIKNGSSAARPPINTASLVWSCFEVAPSWSSDGNICVTPKACPRGMIVTLWTWSDSVRARATRACPASWYAVRFRLFQGWSCSFFVHP